MTNIFLDPKVHGVVEALRQVSDADLDSMPLEQALRIARPQIAYPPPPLGTEDFTIASNDGTELRARLYFPEDRSVKAPVLLHLHGGGFVSGSIEQDDARCHKLAREVNCIVLSVDYRLAPEYKFPTAIEDAFSAWNWMIANASEFGGDFQRCMISGSSSGGHIAIGVTMLAKECGAPMPIFQLLAYPALDPRMETETYRAFCDGPFMTRHRMAWYWKQYSSHEAAKQPTLWSPLAADLSGFPPAHVITAEYDVLRDEGEAYAQTLRAAGVACTVERFPRMVHGFITLVPDHDASYQALMSSAGALRRPLP